MYTRIKWACSVEFYGTTYLFEIYNYTICKNVIIYYLENLHYSFLHLYIQRMIFLYSYPTYGKDDWWVPVKCTIVMITTQK